MDREIYHGIREVVNLIKDRSTMPKITKSFWLELNKDALKKALKDESYRAFIMGKEFDDAAYIDELWNSYGAEETAEDGGPGSGNHGHAGRPGKRGGSAPSKFKSMGSSREERTKFRDSLAQQCQDKLRQYNSEARKARYDHELATSYLKTCNSHIEFAKPLLGVTKENLEEKKEEYRKKFEAAKEASELAYHRALRGRKRADVTAWRQAQEELYNAQKDYKLFQYNVEDNMKELQEELDKKPELERKVEETRKELDKVNAKMQVHIDEYRKDLTQMNARILRGIPNPSKIKTLGDAEEYLTAKAYFDNSTRKEQMGMPKGTPVGGETVNLKGCNIDVAKSFCGTVDKIYERFPEMTGFVETLKTDSSKGTTTVMAWFRHSDEGDGGSLYLNPQYFNELKNGEKLQYGTFHPAITSQNQYYGHDAIIAHESGHALDSFLCTKYKDVAEDVKTTVRGRTYTSQSVAPAILKQAAKNLGISQKALKEGISGYACKNVKEAFAEAFSEYIVSDTPRPAAAEIGRQIMSLYSRGELVGKEKRR